MLSASASTSIAWLTPPISAVPMRVTSRPLIAGTSAASGLRKIEQQHHEQDRKRDQLALVERVERCLVDRPHERRQPGQLRRQRRAGRSASGPARPPASSRRRSARTASDLKRQQRLTGRLAQRRARRRSPTGSGPRRRRCAPARCDELGPVALDHLGRPLEQDRHADRAAELLLGQLRRPAPSRCRGSGGPSRGGCRARRPAKKSATHEGQRPDQRAPVRVAWIAKRASCLMPAGRS